MSTTNEPLKTSWADELENLIRQVQNETLRFALLGLILSGIFMIGLTGFVSDPIPYLVCGAGMVLLAVSGWFILRWNNLVCAWLILMGSLSLLALFARSSGLNEIIVLFPVLAGMAALLISRRVGLVMAWIFTFILLFASRLGLAVPVSLQVLTLLALWSVVLILWLALKPLVESVNWAWQGYQESQAALAQAQQSQAQLIQALEDVRSVNDQLTRLNRLAHTLRQAAEEERQAKEQFVANVSHELRTPLNMIVGFSEMILNDPASYGESLPQPLLADLAVILRNSQHLSSLIDDVLDLSQVESGQVALSKEKNSLKEIIEAAVIAVRPLYTTKNLFLKTELPDTLPLISCDRTRIREVVLNLLSNAGRFTDQGGVTVRAWQAGNNLLVSVEDTGKGIAEADQEKLFRPFQQLDGSIRRTYGGTGLGLSISKKFVELHEGSMWVESKLGVGSIFSFSLPLYSSEPFNTALRWFNPYTPYEERVHIPEIEIRPQQVRLVIVEQSYALQRLLHRYMDDVQLVSYESLESAIEYLQTQPAQALIINEIPGEPDIFQLRYPSNLPEGMPVLYCSVPGVELSYSQQGVSDYLVKPISREALLAALDRLVGKIETILIVDDEPDALQLFRRMLISAKRGYRILRASSGTKALNILRQENVDLILMDLLMPEMNGFQFLAEREIDERLKKIPVILISARDPYGHPIVSRMLAATNPQGLSVQQLINGIRGLLTILGNSSLADDPAQPGRTPG